MCVCVCEWVEVCHGNIVLVCVCVCQPNEGKQNFEHNFHFGIVLLIIHRCVLRCDKN